MEGRSQSVAPLSIFYGIFIKFSISLFRWYITNHQTFFCTREMVAFSVGNRCKRHQYWCHLIGRNHIRFVN
jgi:hypothetical protein